MMLARERRRVALLIETSEECGRGIIQGIIRYANLYGHWDFHITPGYEEQEVSVLNKWKGDGVIARVMSDELATVLLEKKLPLILLGHPDTQRPIIQEHGPYYDICVTNKTLGRMAAEYFLKKGFERFAIFSVTHTAQWSQERETGFRDRLAEEGISAKDIFPLYAREERGNVEFSRSLENKLKNLPKPVAVLAVSDRDGQKLIERCSLQKISVPADVSVLGIDNDNLLCISSSPPLSSIAIDAEGAGFQAASILDRMMNDPNDPELKPGIIPLGPVMIHERQSTNVDQFSDRMVSEIFAFLRENVNISINVTDVVRAVRKSRRVVETRFKRATGETVHEAILRLKLDEVKRFLISSNLPIHQVALETGFEDDGYLGQVFKRKFGFTMEAYRRRYHKE